jgi:cbb3-type cytochrome oxidase maturation protein
VSSFGISIPATLLLAAVLLVLVLRAVRRGDFDDWEGPAARHFLDADDCPERDQERAHENGGAGSPAPPSTGPPDDRS